MSITSLDMDKIDTLIKSHQTFTISDVKDMSLVVKMIEDTIKNRLLRCRVYTANRSASLCAWFIPTGITQITALASAIGMAAHNIATYNPDYEIRKHHFDNRIDVIYKK